MCSITHNSTDIKSIIQLVFIKTWALKQLKKMDRFSCPLEIKFEKWILLPKYYDIFYFIAWIGIFLLQIDFFKHQQEASNTIKGS